MNRLFSGCMIIVMVSFFGFLTETIWLILTKGYFDNRNMLFPFLLGYGLAVMAIYAAFGTPQAPRLFAWRLPFCSGCLKTLFYFLIVSICIMGGECLLGILVEQTTGIVWWNYSRIPLHVTRYTSLPTTVCFSTLLMLFMRWSFLPLYHGFLRIKGKWFGILALTLMGLLVADFIHSGLYMLQTRELLSTFRIDLSSVSDAIPTVSQHSP